MKLRGGKLQAKKVCVRTGGKIAGTPCHRMLWMQKAYEINRRWIST